MALGQNVMPLKARGVTNEVGQYFSVTTSKKVIEKRKENIIRLKTMTVFLVIVL